MTERVVTIQWLRIAAALSVVAYHELGMLWADDPAAKARLRFAGNIGVDIFFCISGFVMVLTACAPGARFDAGGFLLRRLIRIAPTYWTLTLGLAAASQFMPGLFHAPLWHGLAHLLSSLAFLPDGQPLIIYQGWTLSFEMLFYCLIAGVRSSSPTLTAGRIVLTALAATLLGLLYRPTAPIAEWLTSPFLLEFAGGAVIGALYLRGTLADRTIASRTVLAMLAAMMTGVFFLWHADDPASLAHALFTDPDLSRVVTKGVPTAFLVFCLVSAEACGWRVPRRGMVLCDASYAIYLIQVVAEPLSIRLMAPLGLTWPVALVLSVSFTALAGFLLYIGFERPVTAALNRRLRASTRQERLSLAP